MTPSNGIINRMVVLLGLLLLIPVAIAVQMMRIQWVEGDALRALWSSQALDEIEVPAQRGLILDRDGSVLATNRMEARVILDPQAPGMTQAKVDTVLSVLSRVTGTPVRDYRARMQQSRQSPRYMVLERNATMEAVEAVRGLRFNGVILEESFKRAYNYGSLAAHVLGFMSHEMVGLSGLEASYDEQLRGEPGAQQVRRDRSNRIYAYVGAPRRQPVHGYDLQTTIDATIQAIVEEELAAGVAKHKALRGTAIVMDPQTGAIVAMANVPTYDPNQPAASETASRRNWAIADMIEPGSTFKLVTAIAAVEQGVVETDEVFETPANGQFLIHGQMMRDHEPLGTLDFTQVIAKSSNVATSQIAMRLEKQVFFQYARNMGFGSPTNIDLPNEREGRLQKPYEWSLVTLPWMSIGYEVQATPLQILQAYAAFANGGKLMRPYLVERVIDERGRTVMEQTPLQVRRVAKASTINTLYPIFKEVLQDSGTAGMAAVPGLTIAGKTGTAQKFMDGRYRTSYYASFAGFFPVEDPKYAILVMIDEPRTVIYGGWTAGATFREMTKRIAGYDPSVTVHRETFLAKLGFGGGNGPKGDELGDGEAGAAGVAGAGRDGKVVPMAHGMSRRDAETLLQKLGIGYKIEGTGEWISAQEPLAGHLLPKDRPLRLLARTYEVAEAGTGISGTGRSGAAESGSGSAAGSSAAGSGAAGSAAGSGDAGSGDRPSAERRSTYVEIPNLKGMNMRQARHLLTELGLRSEAIGSGTIYSQFPEAGERIRTGRMVTFRGRARSMTQIGAESGAQTASDAGSTEAGLPKTEAPGAGGRP